MTPSATWEEVRARRLERSSLVDRAGADELASVAAALCGVHAQVQVSAELQLAARVDGITQADVRDALWQRRTLAKAWTVRGTLHIHPAGELGLWLAAERAVEGEVGALDAWRDPAGVVQPRIEADEVDAVRAAVWDALDGRCLLREELVDEVVRHVGPRPRERLRSGFAFFLGDLCQGPPRGSKITLARPDQWIDGWDEVEPQAALAEACRRFLRTYGPSRPADFRTWIGGRAFTVTDARAVFDSLGDQLEEIGVEGHPAYALAGDTAFPDLEPTVRLLSEYDVYIMGFREREHLVPEAVKKQVAVHSRGRYEGPAGVRFVLVDGIPAGLWERKKSGKRVELRIDPVRKLTPSERAEIEQEAERIGAFLGLETLLTIAT